MKEEPTEERRVYEVPDATETVDEDDIFSLPDTKDTNVRGSKRPRESDSSMSTSSVTASSLTDAEYEDNQDWTDPDTCKALFERMKGHPTLRINFDTQRVLKRLDEKHFLERKRRQHKANIKKWSLDMKKKNTPKDTFDDSLRERVQGPK